MKSATKTAIFVMVVACIVYTCEAELIGRRRRDSPTESSGSAESTTAASDASSSESPDSTTAAASTTAASGANSTDTSSGGLMDKIPFVGSFMGNIMKYIQGLIDKTFGVLA